VIDWLRIEDVRERRRRLALEAMHADRRAADAQPRVLHAAEAARAVAECAKTNHWQAAGADPGLNVAALAGAAAWSRVLDERIARERAAVAEAQAQAQACMRAAEASREALRRAAGGVEKAARLGQQARATGRRLEDARLESAAEDLATARWAAQRARKA
jgi:hypothetical protein